MAAASGKKPGRGGAIELLMIFRAQGFFGLSLFAATMCDVIGP
jgi:hypothetical protein